MRKVEQSCCSKVVSKWRDDEVERVRAEVVGREGFSECEWEEREARGREWEVEWVERIESR